MRRFILIIQFILMPFLLTSSYGYVNRYGLHSYEFAHTYNTNHSITVFISANYYYGDIETPSVYGYKDLQFDWTKQTTGTCILQYAYKFSTYVGGKAQLGLGVIRGQSEFNRGTSLTQRRFNNTYMLYDIGVELYPFGEGIYFFVGIGGITSVGGTYDLNWHNESIRETGNLKGNTVPVIPLALGYKYNLPKVQIGFELSWYPALMDTYKCNLDGYSGIKYPVESKTNKFTDGILNFGIFIGYIIQK